MGFNWFKLNQLKLMEDSNIIFYFILFSYQIKIFMDERWIKNGFYRRQDPNINKLGLH
jgi:hypothetical protein